VKKQVGVMLFGCILLLMVSQIQLNSFVSANFMQSLPYITINSDGTVTPETAYINRTGDVYTLTRSMTCTYAVVINCSNIIFDGDNHTIKGAVNSAQGYVNIGLELNYVTNVTVKDLRIFGFGLGDLILNGSNCSLLNVTTAYASLYCSFSSFVACNFRKGIDGFKGADQLTVVGESNTFTRNNLECRWGFKGNNSLDDGSVGNYWGGYKGNDANHDGIGDTPHSVVDNQYDNYPLMKPYPAPISPKPTVVPTAQPTNANGIQDNMLMIVASVAIVLFVGTSLFIVKRGNR
jgi:hypothetical protein